MPFSPDFHLHVQVNPAEAMQGCPTQDLLAGSEPNSRTGNEHPDRVVALQQKPGWASQSSNLLAPRHQEDGPFAKQMGLFVHSREHIHICPQSRSASLAQAEGAAQHRRWLINILQGMVQVCTGCSNVAKQQQLLLYRREQIS